MHLIQVSVRQVLRISDVRRCCFCLQMMTMMQRRPKKKKKTSQSSVCSMVRLPASSTIRPLSSQQY